MGGNLSDHERQDILRRCDEQTRQREQGYEAKVRELKERLDAKEHEIHRIRLDKSEEQREVKTWKHKIELQKMQEQLKAEERKLKEQLKAYERQKEEEELKHNKQPIYNERKIANMEGQMKNMQEQIRNLEGKIKNMQEQIKKMEGQRNNMEEQIKKMEEQIKKMEGEMQDDDYLKRIYRSRYKLLIRRPETYVKDHKSLNINLFGETETGKTSLINSLKYAINGKLSGTYIEQTAPEYFQGAHTIQRRKIALTEHLNVIDNRGVNAEHFRNLPFLNDVIRQMEGKKPREVTPLGNISTKEKSYCAVMVFSAHQKGLVMESKDFILKLFEWQGRFPLAVITHVDEESSQHVRLALGSIGVGDIYEVANITKSRKELELPYQCSLLELLERCFTYGDEICSYRHEMKGRT